jgi:hypothetical protein
MSDYTLQVTWNTKDALASGQALKAVSATELGNEFSAIAVASATKYDSADIASTAQAQALTLDTVLLTPNKLSDVFDSNAAILSDVVALSDPGADCVLGWDNSATAEIHYTLGTGLTTSGTELQLSMLGLEDLTDPNVDSIYIWDDSAGASKLGTLGSGLSITGTEVNVAAAAGGAGLTYSSGVLAVGAGSGLTVNANDVALTDVTKGAGQPLSLLSGTWDFDLTAVDNIEGSALAATDEFLVDDGGVVKAIAKQDMGLATQTAQTTQSLAAADMNTIMKFTGTATLTLDLNATTDLPTGVPVVLVMSHATQELTVTAAASVTLESIYHAGGEVAASDVVRAGGMAVLVQTETNKWQLSGDISTA